MFRLAVSVLLLGAWGCGDDAATQGIRDLCASAPGSIGGCPDAPLESPEDVCWRLVECGSIPLEEPEDNQGVFDWKDCVSRVGSLQDFQYEYTLACVQASTCDELKRDGSPSSGSVPLCLLHGEQ